MSTAPTRERLLLLHRLLDAEHPPRIAALRVQPPDGVAERVVEDVLFDEVSTRKDLLVGALGCGKSTELRAVAEALRGSHTVVSIDLDASGITASSLSAFDLLYLGSLSLLRHLPEGDRVALFRDLARAYARTESADALGSVADALAGLASFGALAADAAGTLGGVPGAGTGLAAVAGAVAGGVRLFTRKEGGVVDASSPEGRALQQVARTIVHAARRRAERPIVLVDGLEKMNGEAAERFRQVFQYTRLLADAPWPAVIAAPPASMTVVNSVHQAGFRTHPIYGFGQKKEGQKGLHSALEDRFRAEGVRVDTNARTALTRICLASGGYPRHAVQMTRDAVKHAALAGRETISIADAQEGKRVLAEDLARGLHSGHFEALRHVERTGELPESDLSAELFANAQVLATRSARATPRFVVHPLLAPELVPHDPSE